MPFPFPSALVFTECHSVLHVPRELFFTLSSPDAPFAWKAPYPDIHLADSSFTLMSENSFLRAGCSGHSATDSNLQLTHFLPKLSIPLPQLVQFFFFLLSFSLNYIFKIDFESVSPRRWVLAHMHALHVETRRQLLQPVLSFHHLGPGHQTQLMRLG